MESFVESHFDKILGNFTVELIRIMTRNFVVPIIYLTQTLFSSVIPIFSLQRSLFEEAVVQGKAGKISVPGSVIIPFMIIWNNCCGQKYPIQPAYVSHDFRLYLVSSRICLYPAVESLCFVSNYLNYSDMCCQ